MAGPGSVELRDLEGGWVIDTEDGVYQPINLNQELRVRGLLVRFEADGRPDLAGFCPGEIIELEKISL